MTMFIALFFLLALVGGWREYLTDAFHTVVVYPEAFESPITGAMHQGEFNPGMGIVAFSRADFEAGDLQAHSRNLGILEFAHVLHYHGTRNEHLSATLYLREFEKLWKEVEHPQDRQLLLEAGFLREYAYRNAFEFVAVALEHFFENPDDMRRDFPDYHFRISRMLNQR